MYLHEAQTTLSLAIIKFTTSTPGVANNLYSSCGSEISLVCVRFCLFAHFPRSEFEHFCQNPFRGIGSYSIHIQPHTSIIAGLNIPFLVFSVSNPAVVPANLSFKFKERYYIVTKSTAFACVRIVFSHFVFVHFRNIEDLVTLSMTNRTSSRTHVDVRDLGCRFVYAFTRNVYNCACPAYTE